MMKSTNIFFLLWMTLVLFLVVGGDADAEPQEENDTDVMKMMMTDSSSTKRLGRNKKRVNGTIYASYGLSPDRSAEPVKAIPYSQAAVSAASSTAAAAATASSRKKTKQQRNRKDGTNIGEPTAPGTQSKVDLRPYMSPVENQSKSNSCAANAVAGAYEYLATRAALMNGEEKSEGVGDISRLFIYYVGRKRDQQRWSENVSKPPKDEGMTLASAIEAVQFKGAALQSSWPFELQYINQRPPTTAFEEAMNYKVGDAMSIPLNLNSMRQCLNDGYPILFGLKLTSAFFTPPYNGYIPTPNSNDPKSSSHGLHAMLVVGYNDKKRIFIVRNSWGTNWGINGYCYLSYDYVCNSNFNFVGMYAIQSLTDDDLTPDNNDEDEDDIDMKDAVDPLNTTPYYEIEIEDHYDLMSADDDEDDEEDDGLDPEEMFGTKAEARRVFIKLAAEVVKTSDDEDSSSSTSSSSSSSSIMNINNLLLSKQELYSALTMMGIPMVTENEIEWAFSFYDNDQSGMITYDEFLDMQQLFDGSLLQRQRKLHRIKRRMGRMMRRTIHTIFGSSSGSSSSGGNNNNNNSGDRSGSNEEDETEKGTSNQDL